MKEIKEKEEEIKEKKEEIKKIKQEIVEEEGERIKQEAERLLNKAIVSVSEDLKKLSSGEEIDIFVDLKKVSLYEGYILTPTNIKHVQLFMNALMAAVELATKKSVYFSYKVNAYDERKGIGKEDSLQLSATRLK